MVNRAYMYNKFVCYEELIGMMCDTPSCKELIGKDIDIFIDIQSLYKDILNSEFMSSDVKTLSINVLNMAAHYRHFFRNQFRTNVKVFLVNSKENFIGNLVQMSNNEEDLFKPVEVLSKYFQDIYYINRFRYNPCAIIHYLINNESNVNHGKIVISNDIYSYQLTGMFPMLYLLHVGIKHRKLISVNNAIDAQFKNSSDSSGLSSQLIPLLMAFNKCNEIGLKLLSPYHITIKSIKNCISKGIFINGYNVPNKNIDNILDIPGFYDRWVLCDLLDKALAYSNSPETLDETWKVKRQVNIQELAAIIDYRVNTYDDILNYINLIA